MEEQNKRRSSRRRHKSYVQAQRSRERAIIILMIVAVVLVSGTLILNLIASEQQRQQTRTIHNVKVGDLSLNGLSVDEAAALLNRYKDELIPQTQITVTMLDRTLVLTNTETNARLDVDAMVNAAYLHGRTNNSAAGQLLTLDPNDFVVLEKAGTRAALDAFLQPVYGTTPIETAVTVSGQMPVLTIGPYENEPSQVLTIQIGEPRYLCYTDAIMNAILSAHKNRQFAIIGEYTVLEPKPVSAEDLFQKYCVSPVNASIDPVTQILNKAVYGYGFDITALQLQLDAAQWGEKIVVPLQRIPPVITDDMVS